MEKEIIAVTKQPFELPKRVKVTNTLDALQNLVGGDIECINYPGLKDITLIVNEEGKLMGLDKNIYLECYLDYICGTVVFVKTNSDGDFESLDDKEIDLILKMLKEDK